MNARMASVFMMFVKGTADDAALLPCDFQPAFMKR
jgi:hypothetical protein